MAQEAEHLPSKWTLCLTITNAEPGTDSHTMLMRMHGGECFWRALW
jgi:hypothetical protein